MTEKLIINLSLVFYNPAIHTPKHQMKVTRRDIVEWALSANIYEVNIRQYTSEGTFNAFRNHLPRLRKMGVEILWFMPVTPISLLGRKGTLGSYYACSSYTKINPEFGTFEDFKRLVKHAHEMGFKVIIDWVANHTGWDHEWIATHPEFYKKNEAGNFYDAHGWEDVVDLNYEHKPLWKEMVAAMKFWINECGIDGFRCDMAHLVTIDFWEYARAILDQQKQLLWVAETEDQNYYKVFDATYAWELLHSMEKLYRNEIALPQLVDVLSKYATDNALRLMFTSNHDENSHSGSEWERLGEAATAFAVLCATWINSLPLIYSGQELPNVKRLLFFDKDVIDWNDHNQLGHYYTTLLNLRKTNVALKNPDQTTECRILANTAPASVLTYLRKKDENEVLVVLNLSPEKIYFQIKDYQIIGTMVNPFNGEHFTGNELIMESWAYKIFVCI